MQRLDDLRGSLGRGAARGVREARMAWEQIGLRLHQVRPSQVLKQQRERVDGLRERLAELGTRALGDKNTRLTRASERLRLLGPEQVLGRGYSITTDAATGKILRDAKQTKPGQRLKTRLKSGEVRSVVES
jgi:exodeoxyribonuclease VII large subunit